MQNMAEPVVGTRTLSLDGEWSLLELSGFGRQYIQAYCFLYALSFNGHPADDSFPDDPDTERVAAAFRMFPWKGGWSAVDFYEQLRISVPPKHRPKIVQIEYASPGFIELGLVAATAGTIGYIVKKVCESINDVNGTYRNVQKGFTERKLNKLDLRKKELELKMAELEWVQQSTGALSEAMGFDDAATLQELSPNPVMALKILLSFYRRIRDLAKMQSRGQIKF